MNRLLRIVYSSEHKVLIAPDTRGQIHKLDLDLKVLQSSPQTSYDKPVNAICLTADHVFTKDRFGTIGKWDIRTLEPVAFHDGRSICDQEKLLPDEEPSPTPNRGIALLNGKLYTNNGYGQLVVLDADTFDVIDIRESPSKTFIDCICLDHPTLHALSDVDGDLYIGNIETNEFPIKRKIDTNVVHGVVYDKKHHRFWTTQDGGLGEDQCVRTGVTTIEPDGSGFKEFKISHEDNEFITADPDFAHVFAGGFNGKIAIFANDQKTMSLLRTIGPLDFQIIHAAVTETRDIFALLQTGDILKLDFYGEEIGRFRFNNKCVWTFEPHPRDAALLYAGTDEGVALFRFAAGPFGSPNLTQLAHHKHGFGLVKDLKPLSDGSYVGVARKGVVFKANADGRILWQKQVLGVPRGVAINDELTRCMVASDAGIVYELDTANGAEIDQIPVGSPSYDCVYASGDRRAVTADKDQMVHVYAARSHEILGSIKFEERIKRLISDPSGRVFLSSPEGFCELDLDNYTRKKTLGEFLVSTKENGVYHNGYVYAGGYGYQLGGYEYESGDIVYLEDGLPDFAKAFAVVGRQTATPTLLVGGRGGFINAYAFEKGGDLRKIKELYVQ